MTPCPPTSSSPIVGTARGSRETRAWCPGPAARARGPRPPRAFTLLEVMVVVVIMGIVSFTVVPSLSLVADANALAAAREIERLHVLARSTATATGQPAAAVPDLTAGSITLWTFEPGEPSPSRALDALGRSNEPVSLPARFGGTTLATIAGGVSHAAGERLWFAYDGTPEVRDSDGTRLRALDADATYTTSTGQVVVVRSVSGLVERQP